MGTRAGIILGIGVGFVLGARAGREKYEQIKELSRRFRDLQVVAKPLHAAADKAADAVRSKGNEISDALAEVVKEKVFGVQPERGMLEVTITDQPSSVNLERSVRG